MSALNGSAPINKEAPVIDEIDSLGNFLDTLFGVDGPLKATDLFGISAPEPEPPSEQEMANQIAEAIGLPHVDEDDLKEATQKARVFFEGLRVIAPKEHRDEMDRLIVTMEINEILQERPGILEFETDAFTDYDKPTRRRIKGPWEEIE